MTAYRRVRSRRSSALHRPDEERWGCGRLLLAVVVFPVLGSVVGIVVAVIVGSVVFPPSDDELTVAMQGLQAMVCGVAGGGFVGCLVGLVVAAPGRRQRPARAVRPSRPRAEREQAREEAGCEGDRAVLLDAFQKAADRLGGECARLSEHARSPAERDHWASMHRLMVRELGRVDLADLAAVRAITTDLSRRSAALRTD